MFSDSEIEAAESRLTNGKLDESDISDLVGSFRLVLGPIESRDKMELEDTLLSLNDNSNTKKLAAKMAAGLIRLKNENFGVATLDGELVNSDADQRNLFTIYLMSLLWKLPVELTYGNNITLFAMMNKKFSKSVRVRTVP